MNIDFDEKTVPDSATLLNSLILKFRHLIEKEGLVERMFDKIKDILEAHWPIMRGGAIVDATIVDAPSSTKNQSKERDSEMHSIKKVFS